MTLAKVVALITSNLQDQRQESAQSDQDADTLNGNIAELRRKANMPTPQSQPKAGFWIRVVASLLDFFLLSAVQFVLTLLISLIIGMLGIAMEGDPAIDTVIWLFGASLSIGYAVFFIGYCGKPRARWLYASRSFVPTVARSAMAARHCVRCWGNSFPASCSASVI